MSAALFDPDDIMREVRAKANAAPPAKTANLLKDTTNFSSLAKLAALAEINSEVAEAAPRDNQTSYRVPDWREAIEELLSRPRPLAETDERWARACRGTKQFARGWAAKAMSLGWSPDELFAFVNPFTNVSLQGAAWFVGDSTITAVTADAITLRTEGGATQRIYRKPYLERAEP
jgi:hypothetical protein